MITKLWNARWPALGLLILLLARHVAMAQAPLPVVRANSRTVDVQDGDRLFKGVWIADPAVSLDVYDARRSAKPRKVTFVTDVDSISFDVQPGHTYDFVILLKGRAACHTRLSTLAQSFRRVGPGPAQGPATIPITIDHGKLHLRGTINGSQALDLIFDTGASTSVIYPSATDKGVKVVLDGSSSNSGTGGTTLRRTSHDNRLEVAGLRWEHEPLLLVEKQADAADGIVGYPVFEDKVVEIDYDRMVMIVDDALPPRAAGYSKVAMPLSAGLTSVEGTLVHRGKRASGSFVLDTGATGTMMVNQAFAAAHGLHGALRRLGSSRSAGVGSGVIHNEVALLPELTLAGFRLRNVPIHVELPSAGNRAPPGGALGMEVLQRFNTILDYSRYEVYFRPNTRFDAPFETRLWGSLRFLVVGIAVVVIAALAGLVSLLVRRRRRAPGAAA